VADRDPDTIKAEIDQARDQLASTVDSLAERANPRRLADDASQRCSALSASRRWPFRWPVWAHC
jgi:hypothetical protein